MVKDYNTIINCFILFLIIYSFSFINLYSQGEHKGSGNMHNVQGSITGIIIDSVTKTPIEYANITVYRIKDSTLLTGGISKKNGTFTLEKVPGGRLFVKIKFIGYETYYYSPVMVSPNQPDIDLGKILLKPSSIKMSEVEVEADRDLIAYNLDKKVINVGKDLSSVGGTAIDLMQNIPSVAVDIDGNISLRGSNNVTFLIDGKPSGLLGLDRSSVLEQIPASSIESIEIITNPSAKYDPDGISGIINIITKKNSLDGINWMASLTGGTGEKYNGVLNLNYKTDDINFFTSYDYKDFGMKGNTIFNRYSTINDSSQHLEQEQNFRRRGITHNFKAGTNYFINEKNSITISGLYSFSSWAMNDLTEYKNLGEKDSFLYYYDRKGVRESKLKIADLVLSYKKEFENKTNILTADILYTFSNNENPVDYKETYYNNIDNTDINTISFERSSNDNNHKILSLQTDYSQPFDKLGKIETGYKSIFRFVDYDYGYENLIDSVWISDSNISNHYKYDESIHSLYGIYSGKISLFNYQIGLRLEQTYTNSEQIKTNQEYSNDYFSIFPSIHLKYEFSEINGIALNFSRRINRPIISSLNPFPDNADAKNIRIGNPYLKPEYINSYEFEQSIMFGKTSVNTSLFYKEIDDAISRITILRDDGVSETSYQNLDKNTSLGIEVIITQTIFEWWRVNGNISFFNTKISNTGYSNYSSASHSWIAKINSYLNLWELLDVQINFNYRSPTLSTGYDTEGRYFNSAGSLGKMREYFTMDIGLKVNLFEGQGNLSFRIADIFKTIKYDFTNSGDNFEADMLRTRESRVAFLAFSYQFNNWKKEKERTINEEGYRDKEGLE